MATLQDIRAFAETHRDELRPGEHYDRTLRGLLDDAAHFARLGEAESGDVRLGMGIVHAETGQAPFSYGRDTYKARARRWLTDHVGQQHPDPAAGGGS